MTVKRTARLLGFDEPRRPVKIQPMDTPPPEVAGYRYAAAAAGLLTGAAGLALWCGRGDLILWGAVIGFAVAAIAQTLRG